ncbi:MAG: M23 family metallopeptidase [Anaerolineaceae bacterium]|nr:MAG: M23 family metallopeptidase [Anaerolineaceae bacterium]
MLLFLWLALQALDLLPDLRDPRSQSFAQWLQGDRGTREKLVTVQRDLCPGATFILPADGFIGLLYGDPRGPYSQNSPHQGIDIFSNADPGVVPVYAAFDGYVTREADWKSSLIMRVPDDPLQPGNQVWLYYTHMADEEGNDFIEDAFPAGTQEQFVEQGTLLGYTGNYNGNSLRDVWVHLHFSVVQDDGNGRYLNELDFNNTLDPSPYLGMAVNYACNTGTDGCSANPTC